VGERVEFALAHTALVVVSEQARHTADDANGEHYLDRCIRYRSAEHWVVRTVDAARFAKNCETCGIVDNRTMNAAENIALLLRFCV